MRLETRYRLSTEITISGGLEIYSKMQNCAEENRSWLSVGQNYTDSDKSLVFMYFFVLKISEKTFYFLVMVNLGLEYYGENNLLIGELSAIISFVIVLAMGRDTVINALKFLYYICCSVFASLR